MPESTSNHRLSTTSAPILRAVNLNVGKTHGDPIVTDVSFDVSRGTCLGLVGESGSGKTTSTLALMGMAHPGAILRGGTVVADDRRIEITDAKAVGSLRGTFLSYVPQSPGTALNPVMRVDVALKEMLRRAPQSRRSPRSRWDITVGEVLEKVGLPRTRDFLRRFPHQLSGGQQQRVCIAVALLSGADVMVLDEPTTGLDVVTQAAVIDELQRLRRELGLAMIYISHDLAVVAQIADHVAVMYDGRIVEKGTVTEVLTAPQDPYTQRLLACTLDHRHDPDPSTHVTANTNGAAIVAPSAEPVLAAQDLCVEHISHGRVVASVKDVSFTIDTGKCVALLGESGSGKSTIARTVVGLKAPKSGRLTLDGGGLAPLAARRSVDQRRAVQMVFQNSAAALNPRENVETAIARSRHHRDGQPQRHHNGVEELLDLVRLPAAFRHRYPPELSGGERQRVCIARALGADPQVIVCDEITSALDVSVQASVLALLKGLQAELGLSLLFITHDIGVVNYMADHVVVLERGRVCESGPTDRILHSPESPYVQQFMDAVPTLDKPLNAADASATPTD